MPISAYGQADNVAGAGASPTAVPTNPTNSPQLSVGSYLNQQIGGLSTGTSNQTGGSQGAVGGQVGQMGNTGVANTTQSTYNDINSTNQQMDQEAQIGANMRAAQARQQAAAAAAQKAAAAASPMPAAPAPSAPASSGQSMGSAYQPNGSLSAARNQALATATSYLGDRYVLGGTSHQGIDCSGLVMQVYDQFGFGRYLDSHLAGHQAQAIPGVRTSIANLRPGDLVCWNDGSHIAIYAGGGKIIEAANERVGTVERPLWSNAVFGIALRLPGE